MKQIDEASVVEIAVEAIVYRDDLYPRIEADPATIQKYASDLDVLPPIEVNQHNELIDGFHRWTAHKKEKATTIRAVVTHTKNDFETHYLSSLRHPFSDQNTQSFWSAAQRLGVYATTEAAQSLLMDQRHFVETVVCEMLGFEQTARYEKGYDAVSPSGNKLEIKTSREQRWFNLKPESDFALLLVVSGHVIEKAFFGRTEWFRTTLGKDCKFGPGTKIDARKRFPATLSEYECVCYLVYKTCLISTIKEII